MTGDTLPSPLPKVLGTTRALLPRTPSWEMLQITSCRKAAYFGLGMGDARNEAGNGAHLWHPRRRIPRCQ